MMGDLKGNLSSIILKEEGDYSPSKILISTDGLNFTAQKMNFSI